jgi:subtilisin-like proprotein convertase family protein
MVVQRLEPHHTPGLQRLGRSAVAALGALCACWTADATPQTQTLRLDAGWNLVALQVSPTNTAPEAVFGTLGAAFDRVFAYDATARTWSTHGHGTNAPALPALGPVGPGRGYWIHMTQAVPAWSVTGEPPAQTPAVALGTGWNMIGIPVGAATLSEPVSLLSVLAASGLDYDTVLRWERGLYGKFTPADGDVDDFTSFDAARGYWVNVRGGAFNLQPRLLVSVRPDTDVEPLGNYPSFEDVRLSDSAAPLDANTQTHVRFLPGEETQTLSLANTGGGILLWELSATNAPWLRLGATNGVTTIENDVVTLALDRTRMSRGRHETTLRLKTTAGDRSWKVVADVGGLGGDWHGLARIVSVNGRRNPVPDVDLHVSFFEDPATPGLLRGAIDSQNALMWPQDVALAGHVGDSGEVTLGGGLVLAPGDVNNAPFQRFSGATEDIDWNCNGRLDALNPLPFPIHRAVSFSGRLVEADPLRGYVIEGDYSETVQGMSREPIRLIGRFTLRRENPAAFAGRRTAANRESQLGNEPVVLLRTDSTRSIPAGTASFPLQAVTDLQLASLQVEVDITDTPPADLRLTLRTPSGRSLLLHGRAAISSLRNTTYPVSRAPRDSFDAFLAEGAATRGEWRLVVENSGGIPGRLISFGLRLAGQPVFDVGGEIVRFRDNDAAELVPVVAQVFADGLPFSVSTQTDADGRFRFTRLPGIPLNFSATQVGFRPFDAAVAGLGRSLTVPQFDPSCLSQAGRDALARFRPLSVTPLPAAAVSGFATAGAPSNPYRLQLAFGGNSQVRGDAGLVALPFIGPAPLPVDLVLAAAGTYDGTPVRWDYGDGSPAETVGSLFRQHTYTNVSTTGYEAVFQIPSVEAFVLRRGIFPMPSPGHTPYALNFFSVQFTGGGSLPSAALSQVTGDNDPSAPAARATLLQVQHAYAASFDLDLAPAADPGTRFDADGFDPTGAVSNPANRSGNFRDEDHDYSVDQGGGAGQWLLAAGCGYAVPDDAFNPHPRPGQTGDCEGPRLAALCNIGAQIVPAPVAEVYPVTPGAPPILPSDPDPLRAAGADGVAAGRGLRLVAGPLSAFWTQGTSR